MTDCSVNIGKLRLQNPVLVASGTFGYAGEFASLVDCSRLGGIITKTITLKPRTGNAPPRIAETASGMLNSIGLQNEGLEDFIAQKLPALSRIKTSLIVSIAAETPGELGFIARQLDDARVDALELNLSCPNVHTHATTKKLLIAQDEKATSLFVRAARRATKKTLIVKLTPNVTDITAIARQAEQAGADALSLVNTFYGMSINVDTARPRLGNLIGGLSGPAIKPLALKMVFDVARSSRIQIIGMGGIMNWQDSLEFMMAGAHAICVGTANFVDPAASISILEGLQSYCRKHAMKNMRQLTGSVRL